MHIYLYLSISIPISIYTYTYTYLSSMATCAVHFCLLVLILIYPPTQSVYTIDM